MTGRGEAESPRSGDGPGDEQGDEHDEAAATVAWERWLSGKIEGIDEILAHAAELEPDQLATVLRTDQRRRWQRGDRIRAESYLQRYPTLGHDASHAIDLVYGEFLVREELGEDPRHEEYLRRFPAFTAQLERQFDLHGALGSDPSMPSRIGRFEIRRPLGSGSFGSVYRAFDPKLGRDVALKVPHAHMMVGDQRERFLREARAAAQLQHPHVVRVHDCSVEPDACYIAYELVRGRDLEQVLADGRFSPTEASQLLAKVADAAHHGHERGVIHRDLKAANVLIDEEGEPYVSDFGLVRLEGAATLTLDASILGTPAYMAPEQVEPGSRRADPLSDVYSLGVILYQLLTRRLPFTGSPSSVLLQIRHRRFPRPRRLSARIPRDLETICLKAMAEYPSDRYPSARHLAEDLGRWLRHEPIHARPSRVIEQVARWARRRPTTAALVVVSIGTLLSLLYVAMLDTAHRAALAALSEQQQELAELRSRTDADAGILLLEEGNTDGLLQLLEAWQAVRDRPRLARSRALLWSGWYASCKDRLIQVVGHDDPVHLMALGPHGKRLLTVSRERTTRQWAVETGQLEHEFPARYTRLLAFSPDGDLLASAPGSRRENVQVREILTGLSVAELEGVSLAAFSPDGALLAVGGEKTDVRLWDRTTREVHVLDASPYSHFAFSPDGRWLAGVSPTSERPQVRIWNMASRRIQCERLQHEKYIEEMAFSPDGELLATGSADNRVRLWKTANGELHHQPLEHREDIKTLAFSPDGGLLASGSFDGTAQLWSTETGDPIGPALLHEGPVLSLAFSPDGRLLATGGWDRSARLWNVATGRMQSPPFRHQNTIESVVFGRDGRLLATASADGTARVWKVRAVVPDIPPLVHQDRVCSVAFSSDGRRMATGAEDGTIELWSAATGESLGRRLSHPGPVRSLDFSASDHWLVSGGEELWLWDLGDDEIPGQRLPTGGVVSVAFSPDGTLLATGEHNGQVLLWDVATRKPVCERLESRNEVECIAFSPDGAAFVTASGDAVYVWDTATRQHRCPPLEHRAKVLSVSFSHDGSLLAVASATSFPVRLWDTTTWQPRGQPLRTHVAVEAVVFHPTKMMLATAAVDGSARIWDVETGLPVCPPFEHELFAVDAAFSPDGGWLATASFDKTARLWRLPTELRETDASVMRSRTLVALGARLDPRYDQVAQALPWSEWQEKNAALRRRKAEARARPR